MTEVMQPPPHRANSTVFSSDRRYRYVLTRVLGAGSRVINFIMLNPSTADAIVDDPTIRRCVSFARDAGASELRVTNLFAYRSTSVAAMKAKGRAAIGPQNNQHILEVADSSHLIVVAWGLHGRFLDRADEVMALLKHYDLYALDLSRSGAPKHPLYLPSHHRPKLFRKAN